ncbi:MAG: hypothetical protein G01um10143_682 [Parcubacteria group bacterium Gr01-1014_3]|nr:MAG: hypothetical protein G01um10143_682 [Parcubacteria group bacterium Gr01-1014_3]
MYRYSWTEFGSDFKKITKRLRGSAWKFTSIYCASPGGMPLAVCLSIYLGIPIQKDPPSDQNKKHELVYDSELLVVDDVANTGLTLGALHLAGFFIVTLFRNPEGNVTPNIYMHDKDTRYILFPWQSEKAKVKA